MAHKSSICMVKSCKYFFGTKENIKMFRWDFNAEALD